MALPIVGFVACGDDDKDNKNNIDVPTEWITYVAESDFPIDDNYKPSSNEISKVWVGEYYGYDAEQGKNTKIRRTLKLEPNGTYHNLILGILDGADKEGVFESEYGTYVYSNYDNTITYTCQKDSLLDYSNQTLKGYSRKHVTKNGVEYDTYKENVKFTTMQNGMRQWITKDTYLKSLASEVDIDIAFAMSHK